MKQQEQKLAEWKQVAPDYFHKHQLVDEGRWNTIKSVAEIFESLQHTHASKIIEVNNIKRYHCALCINLYMYLDDNKYSDSCRAYECR